MGKDAFLAAYTPVAKEVAEDLGVSHKIVLAQAALGSWWGKSVKGNGLMGVKSHGEEGGVDVVTHEVVNGKTSKDHRQLSRHMTHQRIAFRGTASSSKLTPAISISSVLVLRTKTHN